tara:strand:- start:8220 stop:8711 length:492 start_codon:yes stop_codon:yes gene_type:complete
MITFRNIVEYLETVATKHYMINSFHSGMMDEVDINKLGASDYVILYAEPGNAIINTGVMTYSFNLYILDMINNEVGDAPNKQRLGRVDTYSENLQILQDVINEFKQNLYSTSWIADEIVLETPINAEPFTARFNNLLTGWTATLSIQVNNTNNLCIVPIVPNS